MANREKDYTAKGMITQLDASLKALQTDYIDLYQFHSGPNEALVDDHLWTALDKQVQAGKIRHLGVSIGKGFDHEQQIQLASELNVTAIQLEYNRLSRKPEKSALPLCQQHDYGVLARVPLASGYLSGKYKPGTTFSGHDVRVHHNQEHVQDMLKQVEQIAVDQVISNARASELTDFVNDSHPQALYEWS